MIAQSPARCEAGLLRQNAAEPHRLVQKCARPLRPCSSGATGRSRPSRENRVMIFVSWSKPAPCAVTSFATIRSAFFCASFFRAFFRDLLGPPPRNPNDKSVRPFPFARVARMSALGSRRIVSAFLTALDFRACRFRPAGNPPPPPAKNRQRAGREKMFPRGSHHFSARTHIHAPPRPWEFANAVGPRN